MYKPKKNQTLTGKMKKTLFLFTVRLSVSHMYLYTFLDTLVFFYRYIFTEHFC